MKLNQKRRFRRRFFLAFLCAHYHSSKVQKDERTLNDFLQKEGVTFISAKKMYFDILSEQFDLCKIDKSYAVTDALIEFVEKCEPITDILPELFKVIISEILVDEVGHISIRFTNDAVIKQMKEV